MILLKDHYLKYQIKSSCAKKVINPYLHANRECRIQDYPPATYSKEVSHESTSKLSWCKMKLTRSKSASSCTESDRDIDRAFWNKRAVCSNAPTFAAPSDFLSAACFSLFASTEPKRKALLIISQEFIPLSCQDSVTRARYNESLHTLQNLHHNRTAGNYHN